MMRCRFCGRHLSDPESQRLGYGPECAKKTATKRSQRVDALTRVVDARGPDAEYAAAVLRRMDAGLDLSVRMKRFRDDIAAGRPEPGDSDYACICTQPDGSHQAHCLRSQRARPLEVA